MSDDLDDFALFSDAKDLSSDDAAGKGIEALKLLLDKDDDPDEEAEECKRQGNRYFAHGRDVEARVDGYTKALEYYTKAIDWKSPVKAHVAVYHSNRAQVHMAIQNFGKALTDAQKALSLLDSEEQNDSNRKIAVKACFRGAESALALEKLDVARSLIDRGLKLDAGNVKLKKVEVRWRKKAQVVQKKQDKRSEEAAQLQSEQLSVAAQLRQRNIRIGRPWAENIIITRSEPAIWLDERESVHCRVLILYPQFQQSDTVVDFEEHEKFAEHIAAMIPLPWDDQGHYSDLSRLALYYRKNETEELGATGPTKKGNKDRGWRALNLNATLGSIISNDDYIIPGICTFHLVPKKSPIEEKLLSDELD